MSQKILNVHILMTVLFIVSLMSTDATATATATNSDKKGLMETCLFDTDCESNNCKQVDNLGDVCWESAG